MNRKERILSNLINYRVFIILNFCIFFFIIVVIWKEYGGKFVDIIMEFGGFVIYIEIILMSGF